MKLAALIIGILSIAHSVLGYPTSLNIMPTADLLDPGSMRMEFGADIYDAEETTYMVNAKYLVLEESDRSPAVAFGALDIGEGGSPSYYLAAAKDLGPTRLHLGTIGDRHKQQPMVGCEVPLGKTSWVLADWIRGEENYLTVGLYFETRNGPALNFGVGFPNSEENSRLTLVNISWTWNTP